MSEEILDMIGQAIHRMPDVIRVSASGIIFNASNQVLLQRRADNGYWGLPAGMLDIGESIQQTVIREVLEETGLHVTVKRMTGIYTDPKQYSIMTFRSGQLGQIIGVAFECEYQSGQLQISEESTDIGYFPTDCLPENTMLATKIRIQDALVNQVEPFIR
ncbi:MAG: NUDIX domain-containing protein [SAR202 cluster bacterium]|nr:NUDIX domain-containing protein [SAR202 cluster bacterium]MDP6716392.1 NUDIX domain-containing protein [SAR202 cluster bacterium]